MKSDHKLLGKLESGPPARPALAPSIINLPGLRWIFQQGNQFLSRFILAMTTQNERYSCNNHKHNLLTTYACTKPNGSPWIMKTWLPLTKNSLCNQCITQPWAEISLKAIPFRPTLPNTHVTISSPVRLWIYNFSLAAQTQKSGSHLRQKFDSALCHVPAHSASIICSLVFWLRKNNKYNTNVQKKKKKTRHLALTKKELMMIIVGAHSLSWRVEATV